MAKGYYKMQSPGRTALWMLILSLFVRFPGTSFSVAESFYLITEHLASFGNFAPLPIFFAIFIFCMIFKIKHPRTIAIFCNFVMILLLALYMPVMSNSITLLIGDALLKNMNLLAPMQIVDGALGIIWFLISFRIISRMRKSFGDCEPENDKVIYALWVIIVLSFGVGIGLSVLTFFQPLIQFQGATGYLSMLAYLMYFFPVIFMADLAITAYRTYKEFQTKKRKKKKGVNYKEVLVIIIFIFSWFPVLGAFVDHGQNDRFNSAYNPSWSGASDFRDLVNQTHDVYNIQSTLSALVALNQSVCLVIMGPQQFYNPLSDVPFFMQMLKDPNFSMLICDDHGSTTSLMIELYLASVASNNPVPLALFTNGILRDNQSYVKAPNFPLIKDFTSDPTTQGVSQVVLTDSSSILGGPLLSAMGWTVIGQSTTQYSYVDVNNDGKYDPKVDVYPVPSELTSLFKQYGLNFPNGIPLGGYPQAVFASNQMQDGNRIFLSADASMFNNELLHQYDNQKFAENIINWLTYGNKSIPVVFDESHNIPMGEREVSSSAMFALIQGYVNWIAENPLLFWMFPLWAFIVLARFLPKQKDEKKKKKKEEKESEQEIEELKFRTSSFFAKKINWYRLNKEYNQALILLFRRIERKLNSMIHGMNPTIDNIINRIEFERGKYINKDSLNRIRNFLYKMDEIKRGRLTIVDENEFNDMFFEMNWVANNI